MEAVEESRSICKPKCRRETLQTRTRKFGSRNSSCAGGPARCESLDLFRIAIEWGP
jgi:hypothetical protein